MDVDKNKNLITEEEEEEKAVKKNNTSCKLHNKYVK